MPQAPAPDEEALEQATTLARSIADQIDAIVLTHYPDADTLDTLRPGETDLDTAHAINGAVALELAAAGVDILVQRADRSAFRRWLHDGEDTPERRRGWINRGHLLRGAAAWAALGLDMPKATPKPSFAKAPGPTANRLLDAFGQEEGGAFEPLVEALLEAGRDDVLELAVRKLSEYQSDENADDLTAFMLEKAEAATIGPSGWAELVALPVALPAGQPPDAVELAASLIGSGLLEPTEQVSFLPGWRSPDALSDLSPVALRRVLLDLVAGIEPRDLPPGDTDDLARRGFGVLLGLRIDWDIPVWDVIAADGGLPDEPEEDPAQDTARERLFDRWRAAVIEATPGCVPLSLVPPSELGAELEDFMDAAGEHTGGIKEIRDFVTTATEEAGGEAVVCRPEIVGATLELTLFTVSGRYLDHLAVTPDRMPVPAEDMLRLVGSFVTLVKERPTA
jgi:hypothetical protein